MGRNELLNALAYRLGRMIARGWLYRADVEADLAGAMHTNGYVADKGIRAVEATLRSGGQTPARKSLIPILRTTTRPTTRKIRRHRPQTPALQPG